MSKKRIPPKKNVGDIAHATTRTLISSLLPGVGGAAAELFSAILTPPIESRREEWMKNIADGLAELEKKVDGLSVESLSKNDEFVSSLLHASQVVTRNHQQGKREALRSAVLNVAAGNAPNEDLQLMFLGFVDTMTSWHLRILAFLQNPQKYLEVNEISAPNISAGAISHVLEAAFPDLQGERNFYDQVVKDLFSRGLINTDGIHVTMTSQGIYASRTTKMGNAFIDFITSPL